MACLLFPVQLRAPMVLNKYVSLAPLPRQGTGVVEGHVCRVSGWGYNNLGGGHIPVTLRTVTVPIVSTARCNSSDSFNGNITSNMICAGYRTGGKDACKVQRTDVPSVTVTLESLSCWVLLSSLAHWLFNLWKDIKSIWYNKFSKVPALVYNVYQIAHANPFFIILH